MTKSKSQFSGSALKRLKSTLKDAGLIGQKPSKKLRKTARGSGSSVSAASKKKLEETLTNPFELRETKTKHEVIGRTVKGVKGRPGLMKRVGTENRKKTLLVEMERRYKAGGIIDRRFGENDDTVSPEEKMLERFTRERQ
ncbi:1354_t:CDS:2, partial [Paraglomus occultum]